MINELKEAAEVNEQLTEFNNLSLKTKELLLNVAYTFKAKNYGVWSLRIDGKFKNINGDPLTTLVLKPSDNVDGHDIEITL